MPFLLTSIALDQLVVSENVVDLLECRVFDSLST